MKKNSVKQLTNLVLCLALALSFSQASFAEGEDGRPNPGAQGGGAPAQPAPADEGFEANNLVPSYFLMPNSSYSTDRVGGSVSVKRISDGTGTSLKLITPKQNGRTVRGRTAAQVLARDEIVKTGDILLSFRPRWGETLGYAHLQLGISHAGVAIVNGRGDSRVVKTIESPLSYSSELNYSGHYNDLDYLHIVRPNLTPDQRANLKAWADLIWTSSVSRKITFFKDYAKPWFVRSGTARSPIGLVEEIAEIAKGANKSVAVYCSEFAWAFLGLRNVHPSAYRGGRTGLSVIFNPLVALDSSDEVAGLMEGPSAIYKNSGSMTDDERRNELAQNVLVNKITNPARLRGIMSSGHQAVARAFTPMILIQGSWYQQGEGTSFAVDGHGTVPADGFFQSQISNNYSPTAFMIRAAAGADNMKYVGTISF